MPQSGQAAIAQTTAQESGVIAAHTFGAINTWETLATLNVDWRLEQPQSLMRKYLKVFIKVTNSDAGAPHTFKARIVEDGNYVEDKSLVITASGTKTIPLFTRQPPLYFANIAISIQGSVDDVRITVVADVALSRWDTIRRIGTEELLRQEYSPNLCGSAVWNTPTMIPRFTPEEFDMAWNWTSANAGLVGSIPYVDDALPASWFPRMCVLPPNTSLTLMSNVLYGHIDSCNIIWGIQPQAGAARSVGFDRAYFTDSAIFFMDGAVFKCYSRSEDGKAQTTDVTASFPATGHNAWHYYSIYWYPDRIVFMIDGVIVATHYDAVPQHPAGMQVWQTDTIAGDMKVGSGFEIENSAGSLGGAEQNLSTGRQVNIHPSALRSANGNTLDFYVGDVIRGEFTLDVTAVSAGNADFILEGKDRLSGKYRTIYSKLAVAAVVTDGIAITSLGYSYVRGRWIVNAAGNFTFTMGLEAKVR